MTASVQDQDHYTAPDGRRFVAVDAGKPDGTLGKCEKCSGMEGYLLCGSMPNCCPHQRTDGRNVVFVLEGGAG
jgi:hypothetical protein